MLASNREKVNANHFLIGGKRFARICKKGFLRDDLREKRLPRVRTHSKVRASFKAVRSGTRTFRQTGIDVLQNHGTLSERSEIDFQGIERQNQSTNPDAFATKFPAERRRMLIFIKEKKVSPKFSV